MQLLPNIHIAAGGGGGPNDDVVAVVVAAAAAGLWVDKEEEEEGGDAAAVRHGRTEPDHTQLTKYHRRMLLRLPLPSCCE